MRTNAQIQAMKMKLLSTFGSASIGQSVWLATQRTTLLDECTPKEVSDLYRLFYPSEESILEFQDAQTELRRLRSIVLKDAQYLGLYDVKDWHNFNQFMKHRSPFHKSLNRYTIEEFKPLIRQLKSMRTKFDREALNPGTKAWYRKTGLSMPSQN